jgi:hypothetical protein
MKFSTYMIAIAILTCAPQFNCSVNYPQGGNGGATNDESAGSTNVENPAAAGAPKKDWSAICIATETKKPANLNMAKDSGTTIKALAIGICSQKSVISCYSKGVCK